MAVYAGKRLIMSKSLQDFIDNPRSGLLTFEVFMENFDEIIFKTDDILFVDMYGVKEAFPGQTYDLNWKQFFKAHDGLRFSIKAEANLRNRFKEPDLHDNTPFERISTYADIVALTFRYDEVLDIPEIIKYADDKKSITVYVPYQEAEWDRHQSVLQRTMKNDDGSLTVEFVKETAK